MIQLELLKALGIALGLGLLVGLQRERTSDPIAGIRTFGLITVLGALLGWLARDGNLLLPIVGFITVGGLLIAANLIQMRRDEADPGMTTEFAALVMYTVGLLIGFGQRVNPIVISGVAAILLHLKPRLHGIVHKMGEADFRALMRLVLIGLVILPVLPNHAYGPYGVLNPFRIGVMVVLIVGISLIGYLLDRFSNRRAGVLLSGLLAGLISSTAATVSFSRQARRQAGAVKTATVLLGLSSCVVFARILLELSVASPGHAAVVGRPVAILGVVCIVAAGILYWRRRSGFERLQDDRPSSDLWTAVSFGALYAVVLFLAAAAQDRLGISGLTGVTVLSGLTDVDAITLSTAELVRTHALDASLGGQLVVVAVLSNFAFKALIVGLLGGRRLLRDALWFFVAAMGAGVVILLALAR